MDYENMTIEEIIKANPHNYEVLDSYGLHCMACNGGATDTLAIAAKVHHCSLKEMVDKLNEMEKKERA